jgi:hypothetical protein
MKNNNINLLLLASERINNKIKRKICLKNKTVTYNYVYDLQQKKHICIDCNKYYSEKKNLKYHIESKHLGIKYNCYLCKFNTSRKYYLKYHLKNKHNIN